MSMGHRIQSNGGANSVMEGDNTAGPSNGTGNGHNVSEASGSGPSTIRPVRLEGKFMYADDADWAEYQTGYEDIMEDDDEEANRAAKTQRTGVAGGKRMPVDREEVVRLILQGLRDIGYDQSADVLEAESGYQLAVSAATDFQAAILGGRWAEALELLSQLGVPSVSITEPSSSSSSIASGKTKANGTGTPAEQARFLIAQQRYLEYLELEQQKKALSILRGELARLTTQSDVLHTLSGYMMCLDKDDLYERASWDGAAGTSRRQLLQALQAFISPQVMVPSRRLATLLDQARRHQQQSCTYHDQSRPASLYTDHECTTTQFPSITTHILADHTDEVWRIDWSPDGMKLASAGKDQQVVIWGLKVTPKASGGLQYTIEPLHHLRDHREEVDCFAWSPDGKTLVTAGGRTLFMWDAETGLRKSTPAMDEHADTISAIRWMPDGSRFLVSSMDCKFVTYSPTGSVLKALTFPSVQIVDFIITHDMRFIIASSTSLKRVAFENKLKPAMSAAVETTEGADRLGGFGYGSMEHNLIKIHLADYEIVDWSHDLRTTITCVHPSADGKRVLFSCADEVQLWSIEPHLRFLRRFTGHVQSRFLIRSGFGAPQDRFILSGSEDGHIYVWQANSPNPIEVLAGHRDVVNAVAWNPVASRRLFASCSDDTTVLIWQPPSGVLEDSDTTMPIDVPSNNGNTNNGIDANAEGMLL